MADVSKVVRPAAIGAVVAAGFLPVALLALGALDQPGAPPDPALPSVTHPSFDSFDLIGTFAPGLGTAMLITLALEVVAVPLTIVMASGAGLALVRGGAATRAVVGTVLALAVFVPPVTVVVPRFVLLSELHLADGYAPLLLAGTAPFYVALYALAFARLPRGVLDAAAAAGAGPLRLWARVAMPLARPATFAVAVLAFAQHWGNAIDAVLHLGSRRPGTVSLVLERLGSLEPTYHPVFLAAALIISLPPLLAVLLGHRLFLGRTIEP